MEPHLLARVKIEDSLVSVSHHSPTHKRKLPDEGKENDRLDSSTHQPKETCRMSHSGKRGKTSASDGETSARESLKAVPFKDKDWAAKVAYRQSSISSILFSPLVPQDAPSPKDSKRPAYVQH
jgi:hypothetical protein